MKILILSMTIRFFYDYKKITAENSLKSSKFRHPDKANQETKSCPLGTTKPQKRTESIPLKHKVVQKRHISMDCQRDTMRTLA